MSISQLIDKARAAQKLYEHNADQNRYDLAAKAAAWALLKDEHNDSLSKQAVEDTGLGKVDSKITKNFRKTLGLLNDLQGVKTYGIIGEDKASGLTTIARPIGVIGAVVPSTNPLATLAHNVINALKCGNAIIVSPSPKGAKVAEKLIGYMHAELAKLDLPVDLVQMTPMPPNKENTQELLEQADLAIVTGSQDNVRRAYSSGTPALGVGAGNVSVIVDETADIEKAAENITLSKCFDNATSCSSENAIIAVDAIYDKLIKALQRQGAILLSSPQTDNVRQKLRINGQINRNILAQDLDKVAVEFGLTIADTSKFLIAEESADNISKDNPLCLEKMSLIVSLFRAKDFDSASAIASKLLAIQGAGHSVGLQSNNDQRAVHLGKILPTCRIIVNQAHCFATGGAFNNGMKFSLSMGCGSWGGNSIDDNLHYKHFMNIVKIVRPIDSNENLQTLQKDVLADYFAEISKHGN